MLTYTPPDKKPLPKSPEKPWLLILLVFIWLWPGILGRDLWGPQESKLYEYITSILETKIWLLPNIYDVPYLSSSPLYLWLGTLTQFLFTNLGVSAYVSVRLLTVILMCLSLIILGIAGKNFLGRHYGRVSVLIIIGCVGIIIFGHEISQLPLLFFALTLYSYALSQYYADKIFKIGFWVALSWTIAFYTGNLPSLLLLIIISLLLPIHPCWRNKQYFLVLLVSFSLFLPLSALWPSALYTVHPVQFKTWLDFYSLGAYGGVSLFFYSYPSWYYLKNIIWYAFPAWPLALWAIIKLKAKIYQNPNNFFFILWIILGFLLLLFQKHTENNQLILIMPPLTFLAASQIDTLKRGFSAFLNWFGIATFGLLAIFIWAEYIAINFQLSTTILKRSYYFNPFYEPNISIIHIIIALTFTPIWVYAISRKKIEGRQAVTNWATGVTFIWLLMLTLFLPWIDSAKSYRPLVKELEQTLPANIKNSLLTSHACIDSNKLETLIAWNEYGHSKIVSSIHSPMRPCKYHIGLFSLKEFKLENPDVNMIWSGFRNREKNRTFILWE